MQTINGIALAWAGVLVMTTGCATRAPVAPSDVPTALRAPSELTLALATRAIGVQIYQCMPRKDQPDAFEWVFTGPEAQLMDDAGRSVGKHYAGPTWESTDGSRVVGEVKSRDAGPDSNAIPWLLLSAKSNAGAGVFTHVASIQRLHTEGGNAPPSPCNRDNVQQVVRVPYKADYYFYVMKP